METLKEKVLKIFVIGEKDARTSARINEKYSECELYFFPDYSVTELMNYAPDVIIDKQAGNVLECYKMYG